MVHGDRVFLRAIEQSDIEACHRWMNDRVLAICLQDGGRLIGNTGLHRIDWHSRTAVLGILIGEKDCWSQGYGTDAVRTLVRYAFGDLNPRKVSLSVLAFNERAVRCYEKCGFIREGYRRAQYYKGGRYVDDIEMAIFAPGCEPAEGVRA